MEKQIRYYSERIIQFKLETKVEKKRSDMVLYTRLILFVGALICSIIFIKTQPLIIYILLFFTITLFLFLIKWGVKIKRKIEFLNKLIRASEIEIDLLNNNFENYNEGAEFTNKKHNFLSDLDIFGKRSIFQLLNRTATYSGKIKLTNWLTHPFLNEKIIVERQKAIVELATKPEWNQHFIALGLSSDENVVDRNVIEDWLNDPNTFSNPFFKICSYILPALTLTALTLYIFNIIDSTAFVYLFFTQLIIVGSKTGKINQVHNSLSRKLNAIEKYNSLIKIIEKENFKSENIKTLKTNLSTSGIAASTSIHQLKKLVDILDARLNILIAVVLNGIFLWDVNIMIKMEHWKNTNKSLFFKWIDVIGEFDAFVSLGMFSYNHPHYIIPEVSTTNFVIDAENMGHPLLLDAQMVTNNYHSEGNCKVDILTGANMAGKSTFLRTIGVNLTMAMIGVPVCATKFKFSPVTLFTSLRTNDSLQQNESFFYAELKRLQSLIQQYKEGKKIFFLLDEILKGTNSKDQHIGSEALIKRLIALNGTGIIATHDVELATLASDYAANVRNLCFEITIDGDKLIFDYKLKNGVCGIMNASFLLKRMGIID
jgi:DNA mismatch repair ATPase MutS